MRLIYLLAFVPLMWSCHSNKVEQETAYDVELVVLGNVQDGGSPHAGCEKDCCRPLFTNPDAKRMIVSLGLVNHLDKKTYLVEATPDIARQMKKLVVSGKSDKETPDAVLVTHAHIGHYSGLMFLGKESMDADSVPVYTMPRMKTYLENNGPWSQLVNNKNIALKPIFNAEVTQLDSQLSFYPLQVVHRDEYSETVGFVIQGPNKKALFIPDIDKWEKWEMDIKELIKSVDYAFLDGTFFDASEINHRDISEIPHPFVIESMELFRDLPEADKAKIHYIHFNHTNSLLNSANHQYGKVKKAGFNIAELGMVFEM